MVLDTTIYPPHAFWPALENSKAAFTRKTMTNVKKWRGNVKFKRLLSDRQVRSKGNIDQVFVIAMLIEVNHGKQSYRVNVYSISKYTHTHTHIYIKIHMHKFMQIYLCIILLQ